MPLSPQKQAELSARRRIVSILTTVGLSATQCAEMMNVTVNEVRNDRDRLNAVDHNRKQNDDDVFVALLHQYAQSIQEADTELFKVLGRHQGLASFREFTRGAVCHHLSLMNASVLLPANYALLLSEVYDRTKAERQMWMFTDVFLGDFADRHVTECLCRVAKEDSTQRSKHVSVAEWFCQRVLRIITDSFAREHILLSSELPDVIRSVNVLVDQFPDRLQQIVYVRYGIGSRCTDATSLSQLATQFDVTRGRVRQLEQQVLRRVRQNLQIPVPTIETLLNEHASLVRLLDVGHTQEGGSGGPKGVLILPSAIKLLDRRLDELDISRVTKRSFTKQQLEYVGDLVQKNEADLLRMPNFGRKMLKELKEVLSGLGLMLGANVGSWRRP